MKNIKNIELYFENTEGALVNAKCIEMLNLSGIEKSIRFQNGAVGEMPTVREVFISLSAYANIPMERIEDEEVLLFDRITSYNDIVVVKVNYTDGMENNFYTKWRDNGGYERNLYQKSELFDDCLKIMIAPQIVICFLMPDSMGVDFMNEINTSKLLSTFPRVYPKLHPRWSSREVPFYFECGDGWFQLLWDLSQKIDNEIAKLDKANEREPLVTQVKEKYGTLRFYVSRATTEVINTAIQEARMRSAITCEICGNKLLNSFEENVNMNLDVNKYGRNICIKEEDL